MLSVRAVPKPAQSIKPWLEQVSNLPGYSERLASVVNGDGTTLFDHIDPAAQAWLLSVIIHSVNPKNQRVWIRIPSPKNRERIAIELELWGIRSEILPDYSPALSDNEISDPEGEATRIELLSRVAKGKSMVLVADTHVFSQPAPELERFNSKHIQLAPGDRYDPATLGEKLVEQGYERSHLVQSRGQYAIRGGIFDVFPWQSSQPIRIEFFDDEVESVREFEVDGQSSVRKLKQAELLLGDVELNSTVDEYRKPADLVITLGDCDDITNVQILEGTGSNSSEEDFSTACFGHPLGRFEPGDFVLESALRDRFFKQLEEWHKDDWKLGIVFANNGEEERFQELLPVDRTIGIEFLRGELMESFTAPTAKIALISSSEIFGRYQTPGTNKQRNKNKRIASARANIEEFEEGDLVVHSEYGIGRFAGVEEDGENLSIEYRDGALLSVPIDQAHLIGRYVGLGGRTPELSKLGGRSWKNVRKNAEQTILDYAARLLRVQAERESAPGFAHPPDSRWMWEFENSFHFTETVDQKRAIEETKRDMESPQPMDRLICGDVGFGKTEVAIRVAFKAVTGGKQVVILCPTTVLAEQHWRTFRERMSDYPVRVDLLNRFRTASEVRETIKGIANGSVDIVIGTHRLLSGDIHFKDLGLAVVDEEQRFGVKHKEKFKEIFRQIDVLTLSATPIPRTLYMALMGARDMSTIDTPPPNRVPVHTSVTAYDERIIRDAIKREMKRGGQVFFLHNRVKSIRMMQNKLEALLPEARILVGHGQMEKDELEIVMREFVRGDADILLATTIIETGIDIPNANTILIDRADRFGLADLYQLRGRVGRAGEQAYAILLLPRDFVTAGDARKRIHAIKQYTALGSGFKVAMRDLEIRGAGNLLGTKQSGQIAAVGFGLYCQLLRQSVERLQGKTPKQRVETTFRSDFVAFSENEFQRGSADTALLPAYLPHTWLADTRLRVTAYREMAECMDERELSSLEKLWADRFGRLPEEAANLLAISHLRLIAGSKGVEAIEIKGQRLMLQRNGDYILLEGRRFPRLDSTKPRARIDESIALLRSL